MIKQPIDNNGNYIFKCQNWSLENKCCKGIYNNMVQNKHPQCKFGLENYDSECKGMSAKSRCLWFVPLGFSEIDIRAERNSVIKIFHRRGNL